MGLKEKHQVLLSFTSVLQGLHAKVKPSSRNKHTHTRAVCKRGDTQASRNLYCAVYYLPGEQQGGAGAQWADEMNGQFPSLVVGESEANLNVFQTADELRPSPAGIHALAEHQLVPYVSAGLTSGGEAG